MPLRTQGICANKNIAYIVESKQGVRRAVAKQHTIG